MNWALHKYHNFTVQELDQMLPYERDIYVLLIRRWVEEEDRKARERAKG